ncbi:MAG: hypothetical protein HYZ38_04850 [Mycobacterium sp.]|nr:hypothetical protein [Mycobacterium sp.]
MRFPKAPAGHGRTFPVPVAGIPAVLGLVTIGVALAFAAPAAADPLPPADPAAPVDPVPAPPDPGAGVPAPAPAPLALGPLGAIGVPGGMDALLLGQTAAPALPGTQPATPAASTNVFDYSQFLNPQNYRVPTPDQVSPYQLAPGEPGPFQRIDALKGVHAIGHGAIGRMPIEQLSEPLPGTAPPPGTNIPMGPLQNLAPDPAVPDPAPPLVPGDPALPPPP